MKHTKLFSILMLLFLGMMAISFTACSSSDDDVDPTQRYRSHILGEWYCDNIEYRFESDGTGWRNCGDIIADFKYTIEGQGVSMRLFTYVNTATGSIWKDDDGDDAVYNPEQNTMRIEGRIFTRTKPTPKPATPTEEPVDTVVTE